MGNDEGLPVIHNFSLPTQHTPGVPVACQGAIAAEVGVSDTGSKSTQQLPLHVEVGSGRNGEDMDKEQRKENAWEPR